jgi:hypothetical protein
MKAVLALLGHMLKMERFSGYRTYAAAVGLVGLSVYLLTEGKVEEASQAFLNALGLFGLREGIRAAGPVVVAPAAVVVAPPADDTAKYAG